MLFMFFFYKNKHYVNAFSAFLFDKIIKIKLFKKKKKQLNSKEVLQVYIHIYFNIFIDS